MLYSSLIIVKEKLNTYLRRKFELDEDIVVLGNLVDLDGSISMSSENKIVISVINIQKEAAINRTKKFVQTPNDNYLVKQPPLYLNIFILVSANFGGKNYEEALKFLSAVLMFFQKTPVFNHNNMPDFPTDLEKLIFEDVDLDFQELSHLWGIITGKYVPSIVYKTRMITIDADEIAAEAFVSEKPQTTLNKK